MSSSKASVNARMGTWKRRKRSAVVAIVILTLFAKCCDANQQQEQDVVASITDAKTVPQPKAQDFSEGDGNASSEIVSGNAAGERKDVQLSYDSGVQNEGDYVFINSQASDNSQAGGSDAKAGGESSSGSNVTPLDTSEPGAVTDTSGRQEASESGPDAKTMGAQETLGTNPVDDASIREGISDSIPATEACGSKPAPSAEPNSRQYHFEPSSATESKKATESGNSSERPVDESEAVEQDDESRLVSNLGDTHSKQAAGDLESARNAVDASLNAAQSDATKNSSAESETGSEPYEKDQQFSVPEDVSSKQAQPSQQDKASPYPFASTLKQEHDPEYIDLDELATEESLEQPTVPQSSSPTRANHRQHPSQVAKEETMGRSIETLLAQLRANGSITGNNDVSPSQQDGTNHGTALATVVEENFKEGSLDSFFGDAIDEEKDLSGQTRDDTTPEEEPKLPCSSTLSDMNSLNDASGKMQYSLTWGVATGNKRYADLTILGMLFDKHLVANASNVYNKVFEPVDDLVIPTLYSRIMTGNKIVGEEAEKSNPTSSLGIERLTDQRSVNSEFVEGLDDLDKFFEGVDPPDELDVGAAGTSIQDVLMGQTSKIIVKRIARGAQYTSTVFKAAKTQVFEYLANGERRIPKIKKKHLLQMGGWLFARGRDTYRFCKDLIESIFKDSDEAEGDEFMEYANDLQRRLAEITGSKGQQHPLTNK